LKKVVRPFYKESDTAYRAYQVNQLDEAPVPTAIMAQAKAFPNNQFHMNPILAISYYTMNYLVKPFDNIHIRQAFALALDKDVIVNDIYKGTYIATNHIVPQGMPGYNPDLKGPGGVTDTKAHPDLAKQLLQQGLQEEGYASIADLPHITFTVSSLGEADLRNEYQADQQAWKNALGINVTMNDIDFNKLSSDITGTLNNKNLMAWGLGWIADYPDPQDFTSIQFAKGGANNSMNYGQNSSADAAQQQATQDLLAKADAESDPVLRMKEYNQAEQQLVNDVAWMPTFQQTSPYVLKPCVANFNINVFDIVPPDDWANTYISTATPCADTNSYK
jgi:oligopeptide transport system substrate-binding protein